jgi:hypothetical protein
MKNKKYQSVGTFPRSYRKMEETEAKIDTSNTHVHNHSLSD